MTQWEYAEVVASAVGDAVKVISVNRRLQDFEHNPVEPFSLLNEMGAEGWEVATIMMLVPPSPNAVTPRSVWSYLLKRPREAAGASS
jgi:hypothetical protein